MNKDSYPDLTIKNMPFLWVGHRGDGTNKHSSYIENTIESFQESIRKGANMIETDCRIGKNDSIILWHDDVITPLQVWNTPFTKMCIEDVFKPSQLELKHKKKRAKLTTLDELFSCFGNRIYYYLELKGCDNDSNKKWEHCVDSILNHLTKFKLKSHCIVVSFYPYPLIYLKRRNPNIITGLNISKKTLNSLPILTSIDILCPHISLIQSPHISKKKPLLPYDVNSKEMVSTCEMLSCIGLTTDILELKCVIEPKRNPFFI